MTTLKARDGHMLRIAGGGVSNDVTRRMHSLRRWLPWRDLGGDGCLGARDLHLR